MSTKTLSDAPVRTPIEVKEKSVLISAAGVWVSWFAEAVDAIRRAKHLSGTVTFVAAGTVAVVFDDPQPDTSYFLALSGSAAETFFFSAKTVNGFTANSSNAASVATINWVLTR